MISKILIPTDGSAVAQKAAKHAVKLAHQLKASIFILSVVDKRSLMLFQAMPVSGTVAHVTVPIGEYMHHEAEGYAEEIKQLCEKSGVDAKIVVTIGHPAEEIMKEAEKLKADLIVIGSHGRSALAATVLGSIAYGVIHNKETKVPVMVVKG